MRESEAKSQSFLSMPNKMKEAESKYEKNLRQMRLWTPRQSWSKESLLKCITILLNEACIKKHEPAGTKYDDAVKKLRALTADSNLNLSQCFDVLHQVIDEAIPDAKKAA